MIYADTDFFMALVKESDWLKQRAEILQGLGDRVEIEPKLRALLTSNADALDAAVCVLAGSDFLRGRALPPPDLDEAKREGWIWVAGMASRR